MFPLFFGGAGKLRSKKPAARQVAVAGGHFTKSETTMASKVAESVRWLQLGLSAGLSAPCALEGGFPETDGD